MSESRDKLRFIFDNVSNWLKFAESKNAALLVVNSGIAFGIIRIIEAQDLNKFAFYYLFLCVGLVVISASICLVSFIPKIIIPSILTGKLVDATNANLLFFGHIAKFTPKDYLQALISQSIISEEDSQDKFLESLANQIVINSIIAYTKFSYFKVAIWLTVAAVVSPVTAIFIGLAIYARQSF